MSARIVALQCQSNNSPRLLTDMHGREPMSERTCREAKNVNRYFELSERQQRGGEEPVEGRSRRMD
eukprot:9474656-Pyramimonas_sp.AAC.2